MKKYLMTAAVVLAAAGSASAASYFDGWRTGLTLGYSNTTAKSKDFADVATGKEGNKSGFNVGLLAGYMSAFGKASFGGDVNVSYDTAKAKFSEAVDETAIKLQPRFGVGAGVRAGMLFSEQVMGFIRLGVDYNWAKVKSDSATDTEKLGYWSFVPGIGVEGCINEKMNWTAQVDYKMAFNTKKFQFTEAGEKVQVFDKKPKSIIAKVGISYKF
jgi:hypothetical protein